MRSVSVAMLLLFCLPSSHTYAQGMRVSTVVYDAGRLNSNGQEPILSSGFSLFHNGRVYDYVEAAGEVVVFEPTEKKFTVLNPDRGVYTTIAFAEVQQLLQARAPRTEEYLRELTIQKSPDAERAARMLQFQLAPVFEPSFDSRKGMLTMTAESWKYTVSTREWDDPEQLQRYLAYTDWASRLNYVLHPGSMFPEPRLALNAELRKLTNRIPVVVQLDLRPDERMVLRAEHQFVRKLTDQDHRLISNWESAVKDSKLRKLPFRGYQEAILLSLRR